MIAIHSKSKETLVQNARHAIGNAHSNSTSVEWHDKGQVVIVKQDSSVEDIMKSMKLKHVIARIAELTKK